MKEFIQKKIEEYIATPSRVKIDQSDFFPIELLVDSYSNMYGESMSQPEIEDFLHNIFVSLSCFDDSLELRPISKNIQNLLEVWAYAIYLFRHETDIPQVISSTIPANYKSLEELIPLDEVDTENLHTIYNTVLLWMHTYCHWDNINTLPEGLYPVLQDCLGLKENDTLVIWGSGAGDILTSIDEVQNVRYYDSNPQALALSVICADSQSDRDIVWQKWALKQFESIEYQESDSSSTTFVEDDYIVHNRVLKDTHINHKVLFIPDLSQSQLDSEIKIYLEAATVRCRKMVYVVKTSWLSAPDGGCVHNYFKSGRIEAVIQLPQGIWAQTSESTCLVVIDDTLRDEFQDIVYVDASNSFTGNDPKRLKYNEILGDIEKGKTENYFDLLYTNVIATSPDTLYSDTIIPKWLTYPFMKGIKKTTMGNLGTVLSETYLNEIKNLHVIEAKDLTDSFPTKPIELSSLPSIYNQNERFIETPAVFFSVIGDKVFSGFVKEQGFVKCPKSIIPVIPTREANLQYIACLVQEPTFLEQLEALCFPNFKKYPSMFSMLKVPDHRYTEQQEYMFQRVGEALTITEGKLAEAFSKYKADTHMRKHAIGQDLERLSGLWENLMKVHTRENGVIQDNQVYGKSTVSEMLYGIGNLIDSITHQVDILTIEDDFKFSTIEEINLKDFTDEYIRRNPNPNFSYLSFLEDDFKVRFSKASLTRVFNNIVYNAWKHGFKNRKEQDNKISFIASQKSNGQTFLIISNNGEPIDENLVDKIFEYGTTTSRGEDGHSGTGCYEIKKLMTANNRGDVIVSSTPSSQYSVAFMLIFN